MSKIIKIINDEVVEIASYRNPEIVFHDSNNPRRLESEYDNFENYCDFKVVINPFELYAENQQLQSNWNSLRELIIKRLDRYDRLVSKEEGIEIEILMWVRDKMNELERNESNGK